VTTLQLIADDAEPWHAATRHPFLDGVRDGTLDRAAFSRWLVQDFHFALALTRAEGRYLANAPREDLQLLVQGVQAMVAELAWFERKATERGLDLAAPLHPTTRAYVDYLQATTYEPYAVQLTALWALECAYLEAWRTALPGAPAYREFVEHWTNEGYAAWVDSLEAAANRVLARGGEAAREAFRWIARYERDFWQMGYAGAAMADPNARARRPPKPAKVPPCVALTIAGSDSGGGAGIQADLKTFQRFGVYGTSALTLVTAQNTLGVRGMDLLSPEWVVAQIAAVAEDFEVRATKTGALGSAEIIEAVAAALEEHTLPNLVVDPVMISKHGDPLLTPGAVDVLKAGLLPKASLVTPNLHEAAVLLGRAVGSEAEMRDAARAVCDLGAAAALVKGGHLPGGEAVDLLYDGSEFVRLAAPRIETLHTHGTGCTYSAAIVALLARGETLVNAVREAKEFISRAIAGAPGIGRGHGPVDHTA